MNVIKSALDKFIEMSNYTYNFIVAYQKNTYEIKLTFEDSDFFHSVGFQYLKDIDIPKQPKILFRKIDSGKIDDVYLEKSVFYEKVNESYANVKSRITGIQHLDKYLENQNLICRYIKEMNPFSTIRADYLIKSTLNKITAYIFIRQRKKRTDYCICSFFVEPQNFYNGIKAYWLFKSKVNNVTNNIEILYNKISDKKQEN